MEGDDAKGKWPWDSGRECLSPRAPTLHDHLVDL
jgi:hypothetical protein